MKSMSYWRSVGWKFPSVFKGILIADDGVWLLPYKLLQRNRLKMMNKTLIWATQQQMVKYHSSSIWDTILNR